MLMLGSSGNERFQFWPPPSRTSWQHHFSWWSFRLLVVCIGVLIYLEHSTVNIPDWLRFYIGMPGFGVTFFLGSVAAFQLGWSNTHGTTDGFVTDGFYQYSRNPQYIFYSISFLLLGLWAASPKASVLLLLLAFWYLRAPFPEEKWLEKQYGEKYLKYKRQVPRYFGWQGNA